jgi:DNA-binding NarL/FixJ family response regulator
MIFDSIFQRALPKRPPGVPVVARNPEASAVDAQQPLTMRDHEMLRLVARGSSVAQAAAQLSLSHRSVERHLDGLMKKLCVSNAKGLLRYAVTADPTKGYAEPS